MWWLSRIYDVITGWNSMRCATKCNKLNETTIINFEFLVSFADSSNIVEARRGYTHLGLS